jgi:hypothetical protein
LLALEIGVQSGNSWISLEFLPQAGNDDESCDNSDRYQTKPHEPGIKVNLWFFDKKKREPYFSKNGRPGSAMYRTPCSVELLKNSLTWYNKLVHSSLMGEGFLEPF